MSDSKERLVETVEIELLKTRSALAAVPIVHFGEDDAAAASRIVVRVVEDTALDLMGAKPTNPALVNGFQMSVEAITVGQGETVADGWMQEVETANNDISATSAGLTAAKVPFTYLRIEDGENSDQQETKHSRMRTRTYPVLAAFA